LTQSELALLLTAKDRASQPLRKLGKQVGALQKSIGAMGKATRVLTPVLGIGSGGIGAAVLSTGFGFNIMKENAQLAFTTLLKDGGKAAAMIAQIEQTAKSTPFKFEDLVRGSQRLLAFGFAADDVIPTLTTIGDAVSAMGGSADMLDRVTIALGQMSAKGKVSAEEMLQLTEAGIPAWQILAENVDAISPRLAEAAKSGKITQEQVVRSLMKMGEQGKLPAAAAIKALRQGMASRFGGLGAKASGTTSGAFSNLIDSFQQLAGAITEGPFAKAADVLKAVTGFVDALKDGFQGLPQPIKDALSVVGTLVLGLLTIGGALVGAGGLLALLGAPGLMGVLGAVAGLIGTVVVGALGLLLSPIALIALAVVGLYLAWTNNWFGIQEFTARAVEWIGSVISSGWSYVVSLFGWLVSTAGAVISGGWTWVSSWFQWLVDSAGQIVSAGWGAVYGTFAWLLDSARGFVAHAWTNVVAWFTWLVDTAEGLVSGGWNAVLGFFNDLYVGAVNLVASLAQGVVDWWNWMIETLRRSPIGQIIETVRGLFGGGGANTGTSGSQMPQGFASGGIVTSPTLAMIGERGAEAVIPLSGRGGLGGGPVFNNYGVLAGHDAEDWIRSLLERSGRRGGTI